jgi:hypothetical protein
MSKRTTFIEQALAGDVTNLNQIHDFVDAWHSNDSTSLELYQWLGMTLEEYQYWAERPDLLPFILEARKYNIPLSQHIQSIDAHVNAPIAARARITRQGIGQIVLWLKETGRLRNGAGRKSRK